MGISDFKKKEEEKNPHPPPRNPQNRPKKPPTILEESGKKHLQRRSMEVFCKLVAIALKDCDTDPFPSSMGSTPTRISLFPQELMGFPSQLQDLYVFSYVFREITNRSTLIEH